MRVITLIPQAPVAITIMLFFRFQIAMLAVTVSAIFGRIAKSRNRTYMRSTIKKEAAAIEKYPKI
jgi:hypothetical protein